MNVIINYLNGTTEVIKDIDKIIAIGQYKLEGYVEYQKNNIISSRKLKNIKSILK